MLHSQSIAPVVRPSRWEQVACCLGVGLACVLPLIPSWAPAVFMALTVLAGSVIWTQGMAVPADVLSDAPPPVGMRGKMLFASGARCQQILICLATYAAFYVPHARWPWPPIAGVLAAALCASSADRRQALRAYLGMRGLPWQRLLEVVCLSCFTAAALLIWQHLAHPDLAHLKARLPVGAGWPQILCLALLFALVNAGGEELFFRGIMVDFLHSAWGSRVFAVGAQAVAFGAVHWRAFPQGPLGVAMATVFALMMSGLRTRSGGLLAPYAVHVVADVVIVMALGLTA